MTLFSLEGSSFESSCVGSLDVIACQYQLSTQSKSDSMVAIISPNLDSFDSVKWAQVISVNFYLLRHQKMCSSVVQVRLGVMRVYEVDMDHFWWAERAKL